MLRVKTKRYRLYRGDNLEALLHLKDNSVDAVITDPPYGLSGAPDPYEMMRQWYKVGHYSHSNKAGFMGAKWDAFVPQPALWKEVFRVLKPGGHLLAFFGSRTYDIGTLAVRLAGFEIRDQIMWIYGQGFPKSQNISLALDKKLGVKSKVVGIREHPTLKDRSKLDRQANSQFHGVNTIRDEWELKAPVSGKAQEYSGWGTSLKPAHEPIVLARKPLIGTVVDNVLEHGTGGINIDACRIEHMTVDGGSLATNPHLRTHIKGGNGGNIIRSEKERRVITPNVSGRWPANILLSHHSDCKVVGSETVGSGPVGGYNYKDREYTVKGFIPKNKPKSSSNRGSEMVNVYECHPDCPYNFFPHTKSGTLTPAMNVKPSSGWSGGSQADRVKSVFQSNAGSAARFFYCAKTSRFDRNEGLEGEADLPITDFSGKVLSLKNNINTSTGKVRNPKTETKNNHPTVKPVDLMGYLCRLVTPPNGIILDPFMGSGSTGKAAMLDGFRFIGMEIDEQFFDIARKRVFHALTSKTSK